MAATDNMSDTELIGTPNEIFSLSMTESVLEEKIAVAKKSLQDIFIEECGSLYTDLLDAIDDIDSGEDVCEGDFHERLTILMAEGAQLSESLPDLSNMIQMRLATVSRAMESLKIKQDEESSKKDQNTLSSSSLPQLRKWLKTTEGSIKEIEDQLTRPRGLSLQNLKRLLASQTIRARLSHLPLFRTPIVTSQIAIEAGVGCARSASMLHLHHPPVINIIYLFVWPPQRPVGA
ncbi:hypothetical protein L596_013471 [Steinernema carpocapsae]|uniref:Uncharacterized protein n=1 Tax=Steinernema carpocapsae TaxID=34508 RepID=A0A4U5P149_STECR|nr:hypothetical protein L596_013471 [Steinernema carpocapsae]